jgi:hypothetical protein
VNLTALEVFSTVFGALVEEKILPQLNANLERNACSHAEQQQRRYKPATSVELTAYYLDMFLEGIREGPDHEPIDSVIAEARAGLTAVTQKKLFNQELNFGDEVVVDILDSVPRFLQKLVSFGSCVAIDEALSAYFGPEAKKEHKDRHINDKPHKDGILTYILCQRLHYTSRNISIAFAPTWIKESPTPRDALVRCIASLEQAGVSPQAEWSFIADSLWSYPSYLSEFISLGWRFVTSAKDNCTLIPKALRDLSGKDLVVGHARTYTDGFLTLQAYFSDRGVTHILTNAAGCGEHDPNADIPPLSYKTALSFFLNEKAGSLVSAFHLPTSCLSLSKPTLVHQITGWDVLREPSKQGNSEPMTKERLEKFRAEQVTAIYSQTLRHKPSSSATKADMIAALCPDDNQHEARHISKRRLDRQTLEARLQALQGPQSGDHRIYDIFHRYYACIDQMDREYYKSGLVRYQHHVNVHGLCVVAYYLMLSCHSIFEELRYSKVHAQSGGNNALTRDVPSVSYADFVLAVTHQFKHAHLELHPRAAHH